MRLFNTVTAWPARWQSRLEKNLNEPLKKQRKIAKKVLFWVISIGFSDPDFLGEKYNIIEPEKSIESAIKKKIQNNLRKIKIEGNVAIAESQQPWILMIRR